MCRSSFAAIACLLGIFTQPAAAGTPWHGIGHAVTAEEYASWDIDVRPDGQGLPPGSGSVADGQTVYDAQCASCHGTFGESNDYIALAGGIGSLASPSPQRTVGSKLNYATTLWDYINRAMPFNNSKTLTVNEVYAVTAYVLNLDEIVPADAVLDQNSLPKVVMPNHDGFTLDHGFAAVDGKPDVRNEACMHDCRQGDIKIMSELPQVFTEQMYGDIHAHFRHFDRPTAASAETAGSSVSAGLGLAQTYGCFACHDIDKTRVGPAFAVIGPHYANDGAAAAMLVKKLRQGGSGVWGSVQMPPQAQISDADLAAVVAWILRGSSKQ